VGEQTKISAGDGGFNVTVAGNTTLTGGQITSTQKAIDDNLNSFQTGSKDASGNLIAGTGNLTITDITNSASYSASGSSVTLGVGTQLASSGAGVGKASGNAGSVTTGGISAIAGNKAVLTGDAETGIQAIFNKDAVKKDVAAQVQITQAFGQQASQAIGTYAGDKVKDLQAQLDKETDPSKRAQLQSEIKNWEEGGVARVALHTLSGALTGGIQGALGAGVSQATIPQIAQEIAKLDVPVEVKQGLIAAAGAAIGAATGNAAGAAAALNATTQNYLSASDIRSKHQKLADCRAKGDPACEVKVLKEYDELNAKTTANINYRSVLTEDSLKAEKSSLERLLNDPAMSDAAKAEARRSIKELEVAINVIQKSPILADAAQIGLIVADIATLGSLAGARVLSSATVQQFIKARTGKEITEIEAARIANNFYAEGSMPPTWTTGRPGDPALNLASHWEKHKSEFPMVTSQNEYYRATLDFMNNPPAGTLFKSQNGDILLYHPASNTFAVRAADGLPRTMFKPNPLEHKFPTNMDFWNAK
jgi:filamentous hemagglutinin